ncbi:GlsB/YeaQ/YmgE family stress response membrane protein [Portibacter marinus]|uniref:GlsB/YeaQ/YmgE family stress response membrane protein n=1 Tax=Portibacter marinus TaxID=2898660 RepID=UPI001F28DFC5|nr:GlsB/YeaQ/YmgE family stress response membrane protein [Portibacter marinus]
MSIESILVWIVLGAIAGWLAGVIVRGFGLGLLGNIAVGIVGAFLGGWLAGELGVAGAAVGGLTFASIITAMLGAVILLLLLRLVRRV